MCYALCIVPALCMLPMQGHGLLLQCLMMHNAPCCAQLHTAALSRLPAVGNVPPFGHRRPLPVIVDTSVTAYQTCYAGGGSEDAEVFLSVRELLRATGGTVADIAAASSLSTSSGSNGSELPHAAVGTAAAEGSADQRLVAVAAAAASLPLPWQPGQEEVVLQGIIAHRCSCHTAWPVVAALARRQIDLRIGTGSWGCKAVVAVRGLPLASCHPPHLYWPAAGARSPACSCLPTLCP